MRLPHILLLEHTSTSFRKLYHSILIYGMLCLILYSLVAAAKTGILLNGTEGVIRTWYNKKDRKDLADYNLLLKEVEMGAQGADERLTLLKGSMSNTAQAAVRAAVCRCRGRFLASLKDRERRENSGMKRDDILCF